MINLGPGIAFALNNAGQVVRAGLRTRAVPVVVDT
jgi:hypothetical protein